MKTYNALRGIYHGVEPCIIKLPNDFELITGGEDEIGNCKTEGHCHYLGCMTNEYYESHKNEFDGWILHFRDFGPYKLLDIHNIRFVDEPAIIISSEEFNKKWNFSQFKIAYWSDNYRLMGMKQIQRINSEFNIDILEVTNRDYFDLGDLKKLEKYNVELDVITHNNHRKVVVRDNDIINEYWDYLMHDILKDYGISIIHKKVNINAAIDCVKDLDSSMEGMINNFDAWKTAYEESDKYMNFEKIKYLE